jgi:hypothetical protein
MTRNLRAAKNTEDLANILVSNESAIDAALKQNWSLAVSINQELLKFAPENIDVLNRLGFALMQLGKYPDSKKIFLHVKELDPYNQIAIKNLTKLQMMKSDNQDKIRSGFISPLNFLEDPGKTKVAQCVNIAPIQVTSSVHCGQEVFMKVKNHSIEIRDDSNRYLGALPDDLSFKLMKLLEGNNKYSVIIKGVDKSSLTVIVREIERGKKFANQPSFITSGLNYQTYSRDSAGDVEKPDITATGEEDSDDSNTPE